MKQNIRTVRNWIAIYYDKNEDVIGTEKFSDRSEHEAENEARGLMPEFCEDWTLTPDQPSPSSTVERTKGEFEAVIDHGRDAGSYPKTHIVANGRLIAVCYKEKWASGVEKEEAEANAAYICKAVNSHDELVEALKGLIAHLECREDFIVEDAEENENDYSKAVAALKKAKG